MSLDDWLLSTPLICNALHGTRFYPAANRGIRKELSPQESKICFFFLTNPQLIVSSVFKPRQLFWPSDVVR